MNVASFVDRDMVMRYFGGGIGHLKNAPPLQVAGFDPIDPSSKEMAVEEDDDDPCTGSGISDTVVQPLSKDVVMNGELVQLEVGEDDEDDSEEDDEEDDEDDSDDDEGGDQTDEDEDGEDDYSSYA
jgi:hypothetical protein